MGENQAGETKGASEIEKFATGTYTIYKFCFKGLNSKY